MDKVSKMINDMELSKEALVVDKIKFGTLKNIALLIANDRNILREGIDNLYQFSQECFHNTRA